MEALAISYIIIGLVFILTFSLKKYRASSGKNLPKRLTSTFIPHVKIHNMVDRKQIKQVFEL